MNVAHMTDGFERCRRMFLVRSGDWKKNGKRHFVTRKVRGLWYTQVCCMCLDVGRCRATETSVLSVSDCNDTADISVRLTFLLLRLTVSVPPLSRSFRQLKKKKGIYKKFFYLNFNIFDYKKLHQLYLNFILSLTIYFL